MEKMVPDGVFNVGAGSDVTIHELAETIIEAVGFQGAVSFDVSKPDGTPRKLLDVSKMKELGWAAKTGLHEGIEMAYQDFLEKACN
jgi:GDP-L-fucose synthase